MTRQDNDDSDRDLEKVERYHREFVQPAVDRLEQVYDKILARLWTANGTAALASVSFVGGVWPKSQLTTPMLIPLGFFLTGLAAMGIGSLFSLYWETKAIRFREKTSSPLQYSINFVRSPSETAGLTWADWRTRMAYIAAICFVVGITVGFFTLWHFGPAASRK